MLAVIFEVEIRQGKIQGYLEFASELRPLLEKIDGFISIERFESLQNPGKILSLSFQEDESALEKQQNISEHREVQQTGRDSIFRNYWLCVARVLRDYSMKERDEASDNRCFIYGNTKLSVKLKSVIK